MNNCHEVERFENLMYKGCESHWHCIHCDNYWPFHCYGKKDLEQMECPARTDWKWISVKDRLPPMYHMVLITGKNSDGGSFGVIKGSHDGDKGQWYRDDIGQYVDSRGDTVTHWMPLPEPPKEGDNPLYDFSGWTTEMIVAKIREIERKKEIAYKEYIDLVASFNSQLRALYNPLSNENHFNCDEPPKEET